MVKGHDSQGVQGIAGVAFHISIKLTELGALIVPQNPLVSLSLRFAPPRTAPHCAASRRQEERTLRQYRDYFIKLLCFLRSLLTSDVDVIIPRLKRLDQGKRTPGCRRLLGASGQHRAHRWVSRCLLLKPDIVVQRAITFVKTLATFSRCEMLVLTALE